ncbi:MAG: response regulator [Trueperaceae bacterium]
MISSPKTVLVADDESAIRRLMQEALPHHLPGFAVAVVADGQEAIDYLNSNPVDVVVTDIAMPVKDGFAVLAHVRNHHPNLPVVVLTAAGVEGIRRQAPQLGVLRVLKKPASAAQVARHVLAARSETARGRVRGIPLSTLLQLLQLERKTCSLFVRSGERRGRLHFRSGELVNAYAFELDQEGEDAARYLLALDEVTIDFERSLHNHLRRIHTPLETLLMDVARREDERRRDAGAAQDGVERAASVGAPFGQRPSLASAAADLQSAIGGLRGRAAGVARALDAAAPALADGARALASGTHAPTADEERRIAAAWGEVTALAQRLASVADALGAPADRGGT